MDISVIIPLYNKALHIERAILSVINQNFPVSELIVIDDGSNDESYDIVHVLTKKYSKLKLFQQENHGVSFTRNKGVELAFSDYVAFLDADDEWKPDFLEHIRRLHNNFPDCGAYATSYEIIAENGEKKYPKILEVPPALWMGIIPNLFKMMQGGSPFFTSSIVLNKKVFQSLNGFPEGIKRGEDKILWIKLGMKFPIAFTATNQVIYHQDATNRASKIFDREVEAITLLDNLITQQDVPFALINDIKDYCAFLKLQYVSNMVVEGKNKYIKRMLYSIKNNKKYKQKWIWWSFWSRIPSSILKKILDLKRNFLN